jgi:valyl-tRNA synthetase
MQWWCKMAGLATPALEAVLNDTVEFHPARFRNLYRHWMENIQDWCISRQLWWGHRIPAWYDENGKLYVANSEEEAYEKYKAQNPGATGSLRQDEDCLDTWFSSWLWPMEVFGWNEDPDNAQLKYYYPTNTLVTAPEIIFFWVARMIMAGYEFMDQKPFDKVYFTGIVRDKQGRKMSKSLGNSPDLLQLIDDFGADAVRFSVLISSPAGNDLLFDESQLEQGSKFCNKMWNAMKLIKMLEARITDDADDSSAQFAIDWMESNIARASEELEGLFKDFRLSEALKMMYSLIWTDFCSSYLEWIKPALNQPVSRQVWERTVSIFERLLQLLHPYMPFITEEIYHLLRGRKDGEDLMPVQMPAAGNMDKTILQQGAFLQEVLTNVRFTRAKNQVKPKDTIKLWIDTKDKAFYEKVQDIIARVENVAEIGFVSEAKAGCISLVVQTDKLYVEAETAAADTGVQKEQLQKDLEYQRGFLESVNKKLNNERFVQNAKPEVVDIERKKQADALAKIKAIEESLSLL